jgi:hypothetical protein
MSDNSKVIATEKGQLVKPTCWRDLPAPTMTREEIEQQYFANSRLFLPAVLRIPLASTLSFLSGFTLGAAHGGKMSGLQFRAEHAHKLPATTTGWYLYHKSKNYYAAKGAVRNGIRTGMRVSLWTTSMFAIEQMFDSYRGTADLLNTVTSFVTVGGWFSLWSAYFPLVAPVLCTVANAVNPLQIGFRCRQPRGRLSLPLLAA